MARRRCRGAPEAPRFRARSPSTAPKGHGSAGCPERRIGRVAIMLGVPPTDTRPPPECDSRQSSASSSPCKMFLSPPSRSARRARHLRRCPTAKTQAALLAVRRARPRRARHEDAHVAPPRPRTVGRVPAWTATPDPVPAVRRRRHRAAPVGRRRLGLHPRLRGRHRLLRPADEQDRRRPHHEDRLAHRREHHRARRRAPRTSPRAPAPLPHRHRRDQLPQAPQVPDPRRRSRERRDRLGRRGQVGRDRRRVPRRARARRRGEHRSRIDGHVAGVHRQGASGFRTRRSSSTRSTS